MLFRSSPPISAPSPSAGGCDAAGEAHCGGSVGGVGQGEARKHPHLPIRHPYATLPLCAQAGGASMHRVTFDPHVTSRTISPPRLSAADKGKGTEGRQDLEMEIAQAIEEGGEEAEITYLVSLWSDQMDSDTGDNPPGHEETMGRLAVESRRQEFWE